MKKHKTIKSVSDLVAAIGHDCGASAAFYGSGSTGDLYNIADTEPYLADELLAYESDFTVERVEMPDNINNPPTDIKVASYLVQDPSASVGYGYLVCLPLYRVYDENNKIVFDGVTKQEFYPDFKNGRWRYENVKAEKPAAKQVVKPTVKPKVKPAVKQAAKKGRGL